MQINHESKRINYKLTRAQHDDQPVQNHSEPLHLAVRSTMQKLVEFRENCLDAAIRARDQLRKDSRRVQTHVRDLVDLLLLICKLNLRLTDPPLCFLLRDALAHSQRLDHSDEPQSQEQGQDVG